MQLDLMFAQERSCSGTSWTRNEEFDKNGYLVIPNLWNPIDLYHPVPKDADETGDGLEYNYYGKQLDEYNIIPREEQVKGSYARYWHPQYREVHSGIRLKIEKIIGRKLYNTYYYDRFYFPGQKLDVHVDRDACEISVTVHVSSNLKQPWPIWVKTPDTYSDKSKREIVSMGESRSAILGPGDGMLYKGCERPHWRDEMPSEYEKTWYGVTKKKEGIYYHQIFFHYVLADGIRCHHAFDKANKTKNSTVKVKSVNEVQ